MVKLLVLAVCALSASLTLASSSLRVHHRIWDPTTAPPPFSLRTVYQVSPDLDGVQLVEENPTKLVLGSDRRESIIYQVALEREGDLSDSDWDISSAKACHLSQAQADIMNVRLSSQDKRPYAIDFFLHPVPHDGSCPKQADVRTEITFTNTTINFRLADVPPSPELHVPPPLSPQGQPIEPEPEKSFIQKYWMYIALGLLTLLVTGGSPAEEEQGGNAQGRAGGARTGGR